MTKHGRGKILAAQATTETPERDEDWTEDDQEVLDRENAEADEENR